jgi:protein-tyrosine kinase
MMSADSIKSGEILSGDAELVKALIDHLRLSEQDIRAIYDAMRSEHISLSEAAIKLQLATAGQIAELTNTSERISDDSGLSIIEVVRRKVLSGRRHSSVELKDPEEYCTPGSNVVIAHDSYSEHSEKLRGLRTELTLRFAASSQAAMLAMVSPGSGEGRSQLAAELAVAFAQLDRRTLLVDADFRNPSQHKLFNCRNEVGLAQAIAHDLQPYLFGVTGLSHLHLLTAGAPPAKPLETLSAKRFEQLIGGWRHTYDFVIFDTPPVTSYTDALTVATLVKRVLLITRANQTNLAAAKEMLRRLSVTHSEVLGAVVNHF